MVDHRRIVRHWREGQAKVLVTLVRIEGSSYRRAGAHMLVTPQGHNVGTISGGCLEAEVVRKAAWSVRNGPIVERYSTLFDDTAEIPYGLGCGGIVDLLLEAADTPECAALLTAMEHSLTGAEFTVLTRLPSSGKPLARVIFSANRAPAFVSEHLTRSEAAALIALAASGDSASADHVYIEHLVAPQRLFILGAGDDARPAVTLAALLGWSVFVLDGRAQLARPERFPQAERVVSFADIDRFPLRPADAIVLMSHSYEQDRAALQQLLSGLAAGQPDRVPGYIGLLGARHRSALLVSEAAAALGLTVAECCGFIRAPVGLDLGGDGPEAVALSVVAEIQSWTQGHLASSRRLNAEEVAAQVAKGGASAYLQAHCAVELTPP